MLKRTKSANKSVLEDAVDNVNTAVTANGKFYLFYYYRIFYPIIMWYSFV